MTFFEKLIPIKINVFLTNNNGRNTNKLVRKVIEIFNGDDNRKYYNH